MGNELAGKKIAFLVAPSGVEQVELTRPWQAVLDAGGTPELVSTKPGEAQAFHHDVEPGDTFPVDKVAGEVSSEDYAGLVLPGGTTNPDKLRTVPEAVDFVKSFVTARRPIAAICHGPWSLVEAAVLPGKTLTSWPSLQTDIRNAGGIWVDEESFTCTEKGWTLVTSRKPDDLDAFSTAMVKAFS
ncbi:type 1 glutamine amidotransferase domain-containing protein [Arthrobacter sp. A5]|uniref:type 1 glutamine amidotransferase domain-containing protein n=1 Tax=Arthrobacter sp. A5 TaxID=576926 RepID=UPI003DA8769F